MDVDVLGSHRSISDDVRERTIAKIGRLGRFAPLLEHAEVRLTHDYGAVRRDPLGLSCRAQRARSRAPWATRRRRIRSRPSTLSWRSSSTRWSG